MCKFVCVTEKERGPEGEPVSVFSYGCHVLLVQNEDDAIWQSWAGSATPSSTLTPDLHSSTLPPHPTAALMKSLPAIAGQPPSSMLSRHLIFQYLCLSINNQHSSLLAAYLLLYFSLLRFCSWQAGIDSGCLSLQGRSLLVVHTHIHTHTRFTLCVFLSSFS